MKNDQENKMRVSVTGSKAQKDKLAKEFNKNYGSFMYIYDDMHSSEGQCWLGIMLDLCNHGKHTLSAYEQENFSKALENFSVIIGDEFDLDLEYNQ
jgi:superoxide dismutase